MQFLPTKLPGAFVIEPDCRVDERGFFARAWCEKEFAARGLETNWVQSNVSFNKRAGTLRGLHYQLAPRAEVKLVRCTRGAAVDVVLDLRPESPTFRKWIAVEITAQNHRCVYVPRGCAHGFQTLVDGTELFYQVSAFYTPEAERGVRWDDPAFQIAWPPCDKRTISARDLNFPNFLSEMTSQLRLTAESTFPNVPESPRLLITGATGFLGAPCVDLASRSGFAVHASAQSAREPSNVPFHPLDLFDESSTMELLARVRPTHLLHLAWIATPGVYLNSPENYAWVEASKRLLRAFAQCGGKRAVLAGTCFEYDWATAGVCREFETPIGPTTVYGKCKNELRIWSDEFGRDSGVQIAWARLFFFYGPREHPARLVSSVARSLLSGQPADCSMGSQQRDFLHTADLADALVCLLDSNVTGPINVGSGKPIAVRQVIETVAEACGHPELVRLGARPTSASEPPLLIADLSRLRNEVGWEPRIPLDDGLRETVDWWRSRRAA